MTKRFDPERQNLVE